MPKENQRVSLSKRLIKEALFELMQKKPIEKISVSELCQKAVINRTTFYRHYGAPKDVLQEIAMDQVREFSAQIPSRREAGNPKETTRLLCRFLYDHADRIRVLIQNDTVIDRSAVFGALFQGFLGSRTVLYKGKTVDEGTLHLINAFFAAGLHALIHQWLTENISKTPEEIADLIDGSFNRNISFL